MICSPHLEGAQGGRTLSYKILGSRIDLCSLSGPSSPDCRGKLALMSSEDLSPWQAPIILAVPFSLPGVENIGCNWILPPQACGTHWGLYSLIPVSHASACSSSAAHPRMPFRLCLPSFVTAQPASAGPCQRMRAAHLVCFSLKAFPSFCPVTVTLDDENNNSSKD